MNEELLKAIWKNEGFEEKGIPFEEFVQDIKQPELQEAIWRNAGFEGRGIKLDEFRLDLGAQEPLVADERFNQIKAKEDALNQAAPFMTQEEFEKESGNIGREFESWEQQQKGLPVGPSTVQFGVTDRTQTTTGRQDYGPIEPGLEAVGDLAIGVGASLAKGGLKAAKGFTDFPELLAQIPAAIKTFFENRQVDRQLKSGKISTTDAATRKREIAAQSLTDIETLGNVIAPFMGIPEIGKGGDKAIDDAVKFLDTKTKMHEGTITENIRKGNYFGAIQNASNYIAESIPLSSIAILGGPAALPIIGANVASQKAEELRDRTEAKLEDDVELTPFDLNLSLQLVNATIDGAAEAVFELPTAWIGKGARQALFGPGTDLAKDVLFRRAAKLTNLYGMRSAAVAEGLSEGATSLTQNLNARLTGEDPNRDLMEGVGDAIIVGGLSGSLFSAVSGSLRERTKDGSFNDAIASKDQRIFDQTIDDAVSRGEMTEPEGAEMKKGYSKVLQILSSIPPQHQNKETFDLLKQKAKIQEEIDKIKSQPLDPVFQEQQKTRIAELESALEMVDWDLRNAAGIPPVASQEAPGSTITPEVVSDATSEIVAPEAPIQSTEGILYHGTNAEFTPGEEQTVVSEFEFGDAAFFVSPEKTFAEKAGKNVLSYRLKEGQEIYDPTNREHQLRVAQYIYDTRKGQIPNLTVEDVADYIYKTDSEKLPSLLEKAFPKEYREFKKMWEKDHNVQLPFKERDNEPYDEFGSEPPIRPFENGDSYAVNAILSFPDSKYDFFKSPHISNMGFKSWTSVEQTPIRQAGFDGAYVEEGGVRNIQIFNPKKSLEPTSINRQQTPPAAEDVQQTALPEVISPTAEENVPESAVQRLNSGDIPAVPENTKLRTRGNSFTFKGGMWRTPKGRIAADQAGLSELHRQRVSPPISKIESEIPTEFTAFRFGDEQGAGGVTFSSKNKDYSEELAKLRGGKPEDVREVKITATNPVIVDLPTNEFSSPEAERKHIEKAKQNGNDLVIFRDKANGDEFYAQIEQPSQVEPDTETTEQQRADIEKRRQEELLGTTFPATVEKVVTGKGRSAGKTIIHYIESKVSSDGEILVIKPKAKFKDDNTPVITTSQTITLQEFRKQFFENLSEQDKEMFDEFFTDDSAKIRLVEVRIGLKGVLKGQVNIDVVSLEGQTFGFTLQNGKKINAKYDAELAALEANQRQQTPPAAEDEIVPDDEWKTFVDSGTVSGERIASIADKIRKQERLTTRESAIFNNRTGEVEEVIRSSQEEMQEESVERPRVRVTSVGGVPILRARNKEEFQDAIALTFGSEEAPAIATIFDLFARNYARATGVTTEEAYSRIITGVTKTTRKGVRKIQKSLGQYAKVLNQDILETEGEEREFFIQEYIDFLRELDSKNPYLRDETGTPREPILARERFNIPALKVIGEGSDRIVFDLGDGNVVKIAKSLRGLMQNNAEDIGLLAAGGVIPGVIEKGLNYVVVPKINQTVQGQKNLLNRGRTFGEFMSELQVAFSLGTPKEDKRALLQLMDQKYGIRISDLANFHPLVGDLMHPSSWGIRDGKPVLIDAGSLVYMIFAGQNFYKTRLDVSMKDEKFRSIYEESKKLKEQYQDSDEFVRFQAGGDTTSIPPPKWRKNPDDLIGGHIISYNGKEYLVTFDKGFTNRWWIRDPITDEQLNSERDILWTREDVNSWLEEQAASRFQDKRGVTIGKSMMPKIIAALENPDKSTALHELFHLFEDFMDAVVPGARQKVLDEYNKYFAEAKTEWDTKVSEYGAGSWEAYFKQPKQVRDNHPLKEVFNQFALWLKSIYGYLVTIAGGVPIAASPGMRDLFDQLLDPTNNFDPAPQTEQMTEIEIEKVIRQNLSNLFPEGDYQSDPSIRFQNPPQKVRLDDITKGLQGHRVELIRAILDRIGINVPLPIVEYKSHIYYRIGGQWQTDKGTISSAQDSVESAYQEALKEIENKLKTPEGTYQIIAKHIDDEQIPINKSFYDKALEVLGGRNPYKRTTVAAILRRALESGFLESDYAMKRAAQYIGSFDANGEPMFRLSPEEKIGMAYVAEDNRVKLNELVERVNQKSANGEYAPQIGTEVADTNGQIHVFRGKQWINKTTLKKSPDQAILTEKATSANMTPDSDMIDQLSQSLETFYSALTHSNSYTALDLGILSKIINKLDITEARVLSDINKNRTDRGEAPIPDSEKSRLSALFYQLNKVKRDIEKLENHNKTSYGEEVRKLANRLISSKEFKNRPEIVETVKQLFDELKSINLRYQGPAGDPLRALNRFLVKLIQEYDPANIDELFTLARTYDSSLEDDDMLEALVEGAKNKKALTDAEKKIKERKAQIRKEAILIDKIRDIYTKQLQQTDRRPSSDEVRKLSALIQQLEHLALTDPELRTEDSEKAFLLVSQLSDIYDSVLFVQKIFPGLGKPEIEAMVRDFRDYLLTGKEYNDASALLRRMDQFLEGSVSVTRKVIPSPFLQDIKNLQKKLKEMSRREVTEDEKTEVLGELNALRTRMNETGEFDMFEFEKIMANIATQAVRQAEANSIQNLKDRLETLLEGNFKKNEKLSSPILAMVENIRKNIRDASRLAVPPREMVQAIINDLQRISEKFPQDLPSWEDAVRLVIHNLTEYKNLKKLEKVEEKIALLDTYLDMIKRGDVSSVVAALKRPEKETHITPELRRKRHELLEKRRLIGEFKRRFMQPRWKRYLLDVHHLWKGMVLSVDFSATGMQGYALGVASHPIKSIIWTKHALLSLISNYTDMGEGPTRTSALGRAYQRSLQAISRFARENIVEQDYYEKINEQILNNPAYIASQGLSRKLRIGEIGSNLVEDFPSDVLRTGRFFKQSGFSRLHGAFEKFFNTYLNLLRLHSFEAYYRSHPNATQEELAIIAHQVNTYSGGMELSRTFEAALPAVGFALTAPRMYFSFFRTAQRLLLPVDAMSALRKRDPSQRRAHRYIVKQNFRILGLMMIPYLIGILLGGEAEDDPRDTRWGAIRWGDATVTPNPFVGYVRIMMRLLLKSWDSFFGGSEEPEYKTFNEASPLDIVHDFAKYKLTPLGSMAMAGLGGITPIGEPLVPVDQEVPIPMSILPIPIPFQQTFEMMKIEDGELKLRVTPEEGALLTSLSALGVSAYTLDNDLKHVDVEQFLEGTNLSTSIKSRTGKEPEWTQKKIAGRINPIGYYYKQEYERALGSWLLNKVSSGQWRTDVSAKEIGRYQDELNKKQRELRTQIIKEVGEEYGKRIHRRFGADTPMEMPSNKPNLIFR